MYFDVRHFLVCCVVYIRTVCGLHTCLLLCHLYRKWHFISAKSILSVIRCHSYENWGLILCSYEIV